MIFERLLAKWSLQRKRRGFHSPRGGLWTDRLDAESRLLAKEEAGELTPEEAEQVRFWMEYGYVVLPGAVPTELADELRADVEAAWASQDPRLRVERDGTLLPLEPGLQADHYKLLDLYAVSSAALSAAFAEPIRDFLRLVFACDPLLFQSLTFERGSADPVHQDTSSVVVTSPLEFAASWIALEDIRTGSGELEYFPGSHRMKEFLFAGRYRNWNLQRDGRAVRDAYLESMHAKAAEMGLELRSFLPSKGDALIWSADLAHGGSAIRDRSLTRWSHVCHYCPEGVRPYYFSYKPKQDTVRRDSGRAFSSSHYVL